MASAWGNSWGGAWGNSWGSVSGVSGGTALQFIIDSKSASMKVTSAQAYMVVDSSSSGFKVK